MLYEHERQMRFRIDRLPHWSLLIDIPLDSPTVDMKLNLVQVLT
jgi:hypothetical protein